MEWINKLICKHDWKTHAKEKYEWKEIRVVPKTEDWYNPITETHTVSEITEVLICKKCGKITKIEY